MATTDGQGSVPIDEARQQQFRRAVPGTMLRTPYLSALGLLFEEYEPDHVTMRLPFRQDLTNDGISYHGGVIAAAMDSAGRGGGVVQTRLLQRDAGLDGGDVRAVRRSGKALRPPVPTRVWCGEARS